MLPVSRSDHGCFSMTIFDVDDFDITIGCNCGFSFASLVGTVFATRCQPIIAAVGSNSRFQVHPIDFSQSHDAIVSDHRISVI